VTRPEQRAHQQSCFPALDFIPQGVEHERTFVYYDHDRLVARYRRIRPIAERAAQNQLTSRRTKPDQFESVAGTGGLVEFFLAKLDFVTEFAVGELDTVCSERPIDTLRDIKVRDHDDQPVRGRHGGHRQQWFGGISGPVKFPVKPEFAAFAGPIEPAVERVQSGADQSCDQSFCVDKQSVTGLAERQQRQLHQLHLWCRRSAIHQYGSSAEQPDEHGAVALTQRQRLGQSQ
jgi:hypothetical protein